MLLLYAKVSLCKHLNFVCLFVYFYFVNILFLKNKIKSKLTWHLSFMIKKKIVLSISLLMYRSEKILDEVYNVYQQLIKISV